MDIDTTGFELGIPTREEMLEHQITLVQAEYETANEALTKARADIENLVCMLDEANCQRDQAKTLSARNEYILRDFRAENARLEKRIEELQMEIRGLRRKLSGRQ
ncbi:hypothetical protein [Pseudomonas sp. Marseille-QA0332]